MAFAFVLIGTVAGVAVLREDGPNVAVEVDSARQRRIGGRSVQGQGCHTAQAQTKENRQPSVSHGSFLQRLAGNGTAGFECRRTRVGQRRSWLCHYSTTAGPRQEASIGEGEALTEPAPS